MKEKKTHVMSVLFLLTSIIFTCSILKLPAYAISNSILDVAQIPEKNDKIDAKYSFIAKFNAYTTISYFGNGWRNTRTPKGNVYYSIIPEDSHKGSIGVIYHNVGIYEGTTLDLKITILDWEVFTNKRGSLSYSTSEISHQSQGYHYVEQKWEFLQSGTNQPVKVDGYFTFNDIDAYQGIQFSQETTQKINQIYVSASTNEVKFSDVSGEYLFFDETGVDQRPLNEDHMFTLTYSSASDIRFRWMTDYKRRGTPVDRVYSDTDPSGEYIGFIAKKPLKTETAEPVKRVSDSDESFVIANSLIDRGEAFTYMVIHSVPDEWKTYYYDQYIFTDKVEDVFNILDIKIEDLSGRDVTKSFNIDTQGNQITASAINLSSGSFYYNTYKFMITVAVREDSDLTSYKSGMNYVFRNKAEITIDGDIAESNEVETRAPIKYGDPQIVKKIITEGEEVTSAKGEHGDTILFYGKISIPDDRKYENIQISDKLNHCLTYVKIVVFDEKGTDITDKGDLEIKDGNVLFTFHPDYALSLLGPEIEIYLETTLDTSDISDLLDGRIINTFELSLENKVYESNEVYVEPEEKESQIVKSVINEAGEKAEALVLADNVQTIVFQGDFRITNAKKISGVILEDNLHPAFIFNSANIFDSDGNDITDQATLEVNGQLVQFLFHEKYAAGLTGQTLYWQIAVNYREGADLSEVNEQAIPNTMTLRINGTSYDSNEVTVTPKPLNDDIKKMILDEEKEIYELSLTDNTQDITFRGHIQINNTNLISSVILKDNLHPAFMYKGLMVYGADGVDITDKGDIYQENQTIQFVFHKEYAPSLVGKQICWELTVNYIEGSDLSELKDYKIPNAMHLYVNDKEVPSNEVLVIPIPLADSIKKMLLNPSGEEVEEYTLKENNQKVTFRGEIQINNNSRIQAVELEDILHNAFQYEKMVVYSGESDITKKGQIKTEGQTVRFFINNEQYAEEINGQTLTWELTVICRNDYNFDAAKKIPNIMSLYVNEKRTDSNEVQVIPAPAAPQTEDSVMISSSAPRTGDSSTIVLAAAALALSAAIIGAAYYSMRKENKERKRHK